MCETGLGTGPCSVARPKKVCVPETGIQFRASVVKFISFSEKNFHVLGGWVGRPGLTRAPNDPPPPPPTPAGVP